MSLVAQLLRTKSLAQLQASVDEGEHKLKKELSALDLTMFGIGAIIGAGIFSSIGTAAAGDVGHPAAGPALVISFIVTAFACGLTALCYAELTSMIPVSGSAYTYAYATLGELMAWIIGWDLVLEYAVSNVAVAISWGDYCRSFLSGFGINIPAWLGIDPRSIMDLTPDYLTAQHLDKLPPYADRLAMFLQAKAGALAGADKIFAHWDALSTAPMVGGYPLCFNLLAVIITLVITWLCLIGIRESARANSIMVVIKLIILGIFVTVGMGYVNTANFHPFAPNGWAGIQTGASLIFFAFIGFDAVSTCAEETRDPGRDLPRGILWSLAICTVVYIAVTIVTTGMLHYTKLGTGDPLALVFREHNLTGLATLISFGALIATTACLLVYQVGQPRIMMSMSRDGLLGSWFGRIHAKFGTPANATLLTGVLVAAPAAFMNIGEVIELTNIGTLFAFVIACAGVMILRVKQAEAPRKFLVPAVWLVAPLGILTCFWLAWGLPIITHKRFVVWLAAGLVIYFTYGARRSALAQK